MTDLPDPGTDPVPEEDNRSAYGFFANLVGLPTHERRIKEFLMATLDPISAALDNASTALTSLGSEVTKLAAQIAALQAGTVTQTQIDAVAANATALASGITDAGAAVDAALEVEGEDDVTPPPVEPPVV